jgi:hypothetical protein
VEKHPRSYGHAWHNDGIFNIFTLHFGENYTFAQFYDDLALQRVGC